MHESLEETAPEPTAPMDKAQAPVYLIDLEELEGLNFSFLQGKICHNQNLATYNRLQKKAINVAHHRFFSNMYFICHGITRKIKKKCWKQAIKNPIFDTVPSN